ncbi:MAG: family 43 glycosylhydrolase [Clostridia bacterium]|nr:family 43 glycosylhydrolase [Clostridia bacterium]
MKKKLIKICRVLLPFTLFLILFVSASAAKTVYLSSAGADSNDGAAYTSAVATIERAYAMIGDGDGTIVLCSKLELGTARVMPASKGTVTLTASDGKYYFPLGALSFTESLTFAGPTVLRRISIAPTGTGILACGGQNVTIDTRVKTVGTIVLIGGYNVTDKMSVEDCSISRDYTVTVNSGTFSYFRGGNRRVTGAAPFGNISGNATVVINEGSFTAKDSATNVCALTGMNSQTGDAKLIINGGTISSSVYAVGRAGTNELNATPSISGNLSVTIRGGKISGKKIDRLQDTTMPFSGAYALDLAGGSYPLIESIGGGENSTVQVAEQLKTSGGTARVEFTNPLCTGADPWVIYRNGYYYMVCTGNPIKCYKSATLDGLATATGVAIWSAPTGAAINASNKMYSKDIWSPELHYIEASEFGPEYAGWWLYFSADDGDNVNHRLYCVRSTNEDPTTELFVNPVTGESNIPYKTVIGDDTVWCIGQSLLRANGKTYLMWTSETGRGTANFKQNNSIALLKTPYDITGAPSIFNTPTYDWEKHGAAYNATTGASYPEVVEGATQVYSDDGSIIVTYTGSGYWTTYYALGALVLRNGGDPLNAADWTKSEKPMFVHQNGVYGPGHAAFTTDAGGNRWMIYHAYIDSAKTKRYVFIQPYTLSGTTFDMNGGPYSTDTVLSIVDNQPSIFSAVHDFTVVK